MSDIKFSCPACGQHIAIDGSYAGQSFACPNCQGPITVPSMASPAAAAAAMPAPAARKGGGMKIAIIASVVVVLGAAGGVWFFKSRSSGGAKPDAPAAGETSSSPSPGASAAAARPEREAPAVEDNSMMMNMGMAGASSSPGATGSGPAPFPADPNPWPQWRGPKRDGLSTETGLLAEWPLDGPPLAWKAKGCGRGFSSVAVSGGKVFTLGDGQGSSFVHAFDETTGQRLWTSPRLGKTGGNYEGTKSSPTVDGGRVYVLGQFGDLLCLNAADGKEVWRKQLVNDFGGEFADWNYAESPLVDGPRLIVCPGGRRGLMLALNKDTGAPLWQTQGWNERVQYVSAVTSEIGGRRHYITMTQQTLGGVSADNGQVLWRAPRAGATAVIPSPVIYNDIVFVTSGYNIGCNAFKVTAHGNRYNATQIYSNKEMINHHGGVVLLDKYVYGHSDRGHWTCMDVTSGDVKWKNQGVGKGAVAFADGHLYCRAEAGNGSVALVEASPERYREKGRFDPPDRSGANSWAHPVIANRRLYLRDQDTLLAYDLRAR
jgi:outer membrane protein assembly factor BamB